MIIIPLIFIFLSCCEKALDNKEFCHENSKPCFKMHGLQEIQEKLDTSLCKMASLDIKDACYSVPVDKNFQKYLKFYWKDELYQFCVLPNGFSPCPHWFTKLLKASLVNEKYKPFLHCSSCFEGIIFIKIYKIQAPDLLFVVLHY